MQPGVEQFSAEKGEAPPPHLALYHTEDSLTELKDWEGVGESPNETSPN